MEYIAKRITVHPDLCNGKPTIRGQRITVESVLDYLSAGETNAEILKNYPFLEEEDISACLAFASSLLKNSYEIKNYHG
ncbi:DUF433 domain-containing protein [Pricia sp.]|uniref:DUF433 domain-containing protein n=1 Tax=Pricia sp. TaxID=2268138 RepID=UPI003593278E